MDTRPTYKPVFTESSTDIQNRMLSNIPDTWRKEDGDYTYDNIKPSVGEVLQLEMSQDRVLQNAFPQYCEDSLLGDHLEMRGLTRKQPTANQRGLLIEADVGVRIPKGYTFTSVILDENEDPIEYTANNEVIFETEEATTVYVTCKLTGTIGNLAKGSQFILQPPIPGIKTVTDNGTTVDATDLESADEAWTRYKKKAQHPGTGGNKHDYETWVQDDFYEDTGISLGKTIVQMCWDKSNGIDGRGTVLVVCASGDYKPVSTEVVQQLQEWLDPEPHGYGYGKAPCGAIVTARTGELKLINITATVRYGKDADKVTIMDTYKKQITDYIHGRVFEEDQVTKQLYPIDYSKVGAILGTIPGVEGYSNLLINGQSENIELEYFDIPELGTVTLS